jgi:uncharacterized protein
MMKNPLNKFLLFDERSDGLYVKAIPQGLDGFDFDQCTQALEEAMVTNYDPLKIKDVVSRGRGQFEKIGPPFRYYNPDWDRHIDTFISPLKATIVVKSDCLQAGLTPDVDSIKFHLKRKKVVYGIKHDRIAKIVEEAKLDIEETVAEGDPPVSGIDATVTVQLNTIPSQKPKILRDGRVDFRSIETFVSVEQGQCIAKKIPATPGKAGKSVTGEEIATTPGKDMALPQGLNTLIAQDGLCLVAGKSGKIFEEYGFFHIQELMEILGNVDYSTGNIKFGGDVLVRGNVLPGFTIEADGNITVRGEVEAAKIISRKGYITIKKGVIGKGCTSISGYLGIHLCFAQDAVINTNGPLSVDKFLLHCTCSCPILETTSVPASIVGKSIQVSDHIDVYQLGNEHSVATEIQLIDKNKNIAQNKLKTLLSLEASIKEKIDQTRKQLHSKTAMLKNAVFVTIQQKQDIEKLALLHDDMRSKLTYVQKNIDDMKFLITSTVTYNGYVKINGGIFPGVTLDLYGIKAPITNHMTNKKFIVADNAVLAQ